MTLSKDYGSGRGAAMRIITARPRPCSRRAAGKSFEDEDENESFESEVPNVL